MPPFPERESSILAILKKKKPGRVAEPGTAPESGPPKERKSPALSAATNHSTASTQSADLLGLASPAAAAPAAAAAPLVDDLSDVFNAASQPTVNNGLGSFQPVDNLKKYARLILIVFTLTSLTFWLRSSVLSL